MENLRKELIDFREYIKDVNGEYQFSKVEIDNYMYSKSINSGKEEGSEICKFKTMKDLLENYNVNCKAVCDRKNTDCKFYEPQKD